MSHNNGKRSLMCDTAISAPLHRKILRPAGRMGMSPSFGRPARKKETYPTASDGCDGSLRDITGVAVATGISLAPRDQASVPHNPLPSADRIACAAEASTSSGSQAQAPQSPRSGKSYSKPDSQGKRAFPLNHSFRKSGPTGCDHNPSQLATGPGLSNQLDFMVIHHAE